jgi:cell filamentation protein
VSTPEQQWSDPFTYAGTSVLRNHFDVRDQVMLDRIEARLTTATIAEIQANPVPGTYDLAHLQAIHQRVFGDVYPWAGEIRTEVNIRKDGVLFCPAGQIPDQAKVIFDWLKDANYLRQTDREQFVDGAARTLTAINLLHPFREGNGRSQRLFMSQLAAGAGWDIQWERLDPEKNRAASMEAAVTGNSKALRELLDDLVVPAPSSAAASDGPATVTRGRQALREAAAAGELTGRHQRHSQHRPAQPGASRQGEYER